jgi:hypothetical protein
MATEHLSTENSEWLSTSELGQLWEAFKMIAGDPEKLKIVEMYLDICKAASGGRLSPEGMTKFKELNEYIQQAAAQGGAA